MSAVEETNEPFVVKNTITTEKNKNYFAFRLKDFDLNAH